MNFNEVVSEVVGIVKRPDLVNNIRREVNAAVSHFCSDGNFVQDRVETVVTISSTELVQTVLMTEFPRWRKFWYIKRASTNEYLDKLNENSLGRNVCDLRDRYYVAGGNLRISMTKTAAQLDVGFYQMPNLLTGTDTFWMLDILPYMVIDRAAGKIFASVGEDGDARRHEGYAIAAFNAFKNDRETTV